MSSALFVFENTISSIRELATLHEYLCANVKSPMNYDDLLRFQIVYSVSALDKLVHDVVRVGMIQTFLGQRTPTAKYLSEKISMSAYATITTATIPPKEFYFEQEIISKLRVVAYQQPENIADGLSYVWDEKFKWQKIAVAMSMTEDEVKTRLKLIIDRRNKIAHEADADVVSGSKLNITKSDCDAIVNFIEECGREIVKLAA